MSRGYPQQVKEFAKVRMEQTPNNLQIARDIKNKFQLEQELDIVRRTVSDWREKWLVEAKKIPIKRLFFDIETSYYELKVRAWQLKNFQKYFDHNDIIKEKQIICISYKWQWDDKVHTLDWRMGERQMLKEFIKVMEQADEIVGHNSSRFDTPFIRTRCLAHGVLMFPNYRSLDTLTKSRSHFLFASNKLDYLGKFTGVGGKQDHDGMRLWIDVVENKDEERLNEMIRYCERDVAMLEDYYFIISPFISHNNNFAVLTGGQKWECPECASDKVKMFRTYSTPLGIIRREMKCDNCKKQYRVSNRTYMSMLEYEMKGKYIDNTK
jgi:uncharacterized protein YprB with RNaseH-like and TPR domain